MNTTSQVVISKTKKKPSQYGILAIKVSHIANGMFLWSITMGLCYLPQSQPSEMLSFMIAIGSFFRVG